MMVSIDVTTEGAPVEAPDEHGGLPVFGLPGYRFHLIHITALVCQVVSISISVGVVIYILKTGHFSRRSIGDRLVFYLSVCDLGFSISHVMDHGYMEFTENHPPDVACAVFAFFLNQFIIAQALFVIFSATNAFVMIVKERKMNIGTNDWRLLVYALGIPFVIGILGTSTGYFGPSGAWCYIDLRKQPLANLLSTLVSVFIVSAFILSAVFYASVWFKIKQVAASTGGSTKYHGTAKVMMLFVAVYMMQWVFFVIFCFWAFFSFPHMVIMWAAVFFSNIGGLFNFLAYIVMKKKYQNVGASEKNDNVSVTTVTVVTKSSTD